jgi:hypothetical protein
LCSDTEIKKNQRDREKRRRQRKKESIKGKKLPMGLEARQAQSPAKKLDTRWLAALSSSSCL